MSSRLDLERLGDSHVAVALVIVLLPVLSCAIAIWTCRVQESTIVFHSTAG